MVKLLPVLLIAGLLSLPAFATEVAVKGLFTDKAMLEVNGKVSLFRAGESRHGVTLISANSRLAVVEIDGTTHELAMSRRISSAFKTSDTAEVRLAPDSRGHYLTPARINNKPVRVMVDTGATAVAMSLPQAKALGIDYRRGKLTKVSTAAGIVDSFEVVLPSVAVGNVRVDRVTALINVGNFPSVILLGNSYLSKVDMYRENGVLVLKRRY